MDWKARVEDEFSRHGIDPDSDVVVELAQHAAAAFEQARAEGAGFDDARRRVEADLVRWCADARVRARRPARAAVPEPPPASNGLSGLGLDLRYGLRLLRREPGFAALAVLVTALGIAASTTLFSVTYGVLLKPLPWPGQDRLVQITEVRQGATRVLGPLLTNATLLAWRDHMTTLDGIAAWDDDTVTLSGGAPERIKIISASASLFDLLQARPIVGGVFRPDDERPGANHVAVLSFGLWRRRFGERPDVVGQTITLDDKPYTIVGVMPDGFYFPTRDVEAWMPFYVQPVIGSDPAMHSISIFSGLGRLRPGVTAAQAADEGTARAETAPDLGLVGVAVFGAKTKPVVVVQPYLSALTAEVRPAVLLLLAAVGLLLVTAIVSVAGMQLAKSLARRREVAVRAALGASGGRLMRQLVTENLLVGAAGGAAGLLLALWLHRLLPIVLPTDFPRAADIAIDWRVAAFAVVASLAASVACAVLPALVARRQNMVATLVEDSLAPVGGRLTSRVGRTRSALMAGQIAIAAILLTGAALVGRSLLAMTRVDRGYEPRHLLTATLPLPDRGFSQTQRTAIVDRIVARLRAAPGVVAAAETNVLPLVHREMLVGFQMPSLRPGEGMMSVQAGRRNVSREYFAALGMHLIAGRTFGDSDTVASQPVVVVNQAFVRRYLAGHQPIGIDLPLNLSEHKSNWQIAGIVDDVRQQNATDAPQPEIFACNCQIAEGIMSEMPIIVVRTTGDPVAVAPALRTAAREAAPSAAIESIVTMEARLQSNLARPRLYTLLFAAFAGFALLIAGAGLFGVLSYSVAQRSREIGVRTALGARPADIAALIVRQAAAMTVVGIAAGLGAALALVTYLGSVLYGVAPRDPASFAIVALVLTVVAAVASFVPARRAAHVDPLKALRT